MKVFFFIRPYFLVSFTWLVNGQCYVVTNILLLYEHKYVVATIFNLSSYKSCHFQIIREIGFTRHYTNTDLSKISIPFLSYWKTVGICHIRSKILTYCTLHFTQCVEMLKKLQIQEKSWKIIYFVMHWHRVKLNTADIHLHLSGETAAMIENK